MISCVLCEKKGADLVVCVRCFDEMCVKLDDMMTAVTIIRHATRIEFGHHWAAQSPDGTWETSGYMNALKGTDKARAIVTAAAMYGRDACRG